MKGLRLHRWRVTPAEALRIQSELRGRIERHDRLGVVRLMAGADVALDLARSRAIAGVIVFRFPGMEEVERASAVRPLTFPYVPGLLSFREAPALLAAFARLRSQPDLLFFDGHGYAHPRRFGIACHLGLLLDRPSIGCAKSLLIGEHRPPALAAGSRAALRDAGETIGVALRTRTGVKPVYISTGHRISLDRAAEFALAACDGFRIPRPTRLADHFVEACKRSGK
jgi:deoxyribonuclease V